MGVLLILAGSLGCISPVPAGEVRIPLGAGGTALTLPVKSLHELREEGVVRQRLEFSCGAASAATILTYHLDVPCSERDVVEYIIRHSDARELALRRGFTLLDLKQYAGTRGVQAVGYRLTFAQLLELQCPVLVPMLATGQTLRHFVVFLGMQGDTVFLADPRLGRCTLARAVFERQWDQKIGMVFSKAGAPPPAETPLAIRPFDHTTLPAASVLALALPGSIFYYRTPNEF